MRTTLQDGTWYALIVFFTICLVAFVVVVFLSLRALDAKMAKRRRKYQFS